MAGSKLKRSLIKSSNPRDCGLVAISITRIYNQGDKLLAIRNEDALRQKLRDDVDAVKDRCTRRYKDLNDPRIAGVLYHVQTPAYLEDVGLYTAAHSVTIDPLPGKSDRALLKTLEGYI